MPLLVALIIAGAGSTVFDQQQEHADKAAGKPQIAGRSLCPSPVRAWSACCLPCCCCRACRKPGCIFEV